MARRKSRFSYKKAMAASDRAIARYHRLRKKNPKDRRYKAKRKTRSDKGGSRKRRRKSGMSSRVKSRGGRRRGPKKGYKQTKQHIAKRIASRRAGAGWKKRRGGRGRKRAA